MSDLPDGRKPEANATHHHILNAASNLLGIALLIIAGLKVAGRSQHSFADEIAWVATLCFSLSCLLSYLALRARPRSTRYELWADRIFLVGLVNLLTSVASLAFYDG